MKIGILSAFNAYGGGGVSEWLEEVTDRLSAHHEFEIVANRRGIRRWEAGQHFTHAKVHEISTRWRPGFPDLAGLREIQRLFDGSDLVYFVYHPTSWIAICALAQFFRRTPVLAGHHVTFAGAPRQGMPIQGSRPTPLARFLFAHHALTPGVATALQGVGSRRVFVCPDGVDANRLRPAPKFDTFSVLFLGRIEREKGVDLLPRIWSGLRQRLGEVDLYLVGSGSMSSSLHALAADPRVHVLGWVSQSDKDRLLSQCHVLIAPSRYEAFFMTGVEAMASGTPTVCFDVGAIRDYVEPGTNGYIVNSVEEMISKVQSIHEDWARGPAYDQLCERARSTAVDYDWAPVTSRLDQMFSQVRDDWEALLPGR